MVFAKARCETFVNIPSECGNDRKTVTGKKTLPVFLRCQHTEVQSYSLMLSVHSMVVVASKRR